jgi:signal transduction histidine kinase
MTAPNCAPARLLIVDDLSENLLALEALIRKDGRTIFQARSGDQALALLLEHDEFALAILDVQMPQMNGFELAALMRGTEKTRSIPIIFVTAAGKELEYSFQGYETGAVDFLYKPLDGHAVRSKVSVFVSLYQQRKEIERQLAALEGARAEQQELVGTLQAMQRDLQHAVGMRDEFMSMVAHELRTPLNTLHLDTQLRKMQADRGNADYFSIERLKTMTQRDVRQIRSMVRLIDDMLDVSRVRSGKLSIDPVDVDLAEILRRAVGDLSHQAEASGSAVELRAEGPVRGLWDALRIEQVCLNLIGNALRYGAGAPVTIELTATKESACIVVEDRGPGIASADQQRIFEKFERAGAHNHNGGLGLGLYITKELVVAHRGTIGVASEPGRGATFTVTLQRAPEYRAG